MAPFITLLAWGIAALNAALVISVLSLLLWNTFWRIKLRPLVKTNARLLIFLFSTGAIVLTLVMEYAGALPPCVLCWWQRIFMYPIAIISGIAIIKNTDVSEVADYVLALSFFGAAVALYQHLLQMLPTGSLIPCDAANECAVRSVFELGYITIPWMALSVFIALAFIAFVARKK